MLSQMEVLKSETVKLGQFQVVVWDMNGEAKVTERSAAGENLERGDGAQAGSPVLQRSEQQRLKLDTGNQIQGVARVYLEVLCRDAYISLISCY